MIVKFNKPGKSFKALGHYLTHDVKAETSKRVAWTHTLNCANDHVASAIHEMYSTCQDAELLKQEAGIRRGGQPLHKPVRHFSLSWHPDDGPTQEQMIEAAEGFLQHMGWQEHQAVLTAHNDKPHAHVHCMLNAVHPETGRVLDDSYSKERASDWAAAYQREHGQSHCPQRELPSEDREASPTRPAWMAMKEAERAHQAHEAALQAAEQRRDEADPRPKTAREEWTELKDAQRDDRKAFFADGKDAYRDIRDAAFRQTREEFRDIWAAFYQLQRDGLDMPRLIEIRDDLVARQHEALTQRRDQFCAELRETRDEEYAGLLASQKAERAQLTARLSGDEPRQAPERTADNQNIPQLEPEERLTDEFRAAAAEITRAPDAAVILPEERSADRHDGVPRDDQDRAPRAIGPRVRDGDDIAIGLTGGAIGGLAELTERLFDAFFGDALPQSSPSDTPRPPPAEPEPRRPNPFAAVAEQARLNAEREEEETRRNAWWDERRSRARDE